MIDVSARRGRAARKYRHTRRGARRDPRADARGAGGRRVPAAAPVRCGRRLGARFIGMSLHVVFSAECNDAMTWQSIGLFHSFKAVGQRGNITRLLACSDEQLATYRGLDVGPTFVHHNMRFGHPLIDETGYPSYNKPASVMFFLQNVDVREDFIALLDTDMLLRVPLDPLALGARRGVVVSAEYSYLVGTDTANATHAQSGRWRPQERCDAPPARDG